MNRNANVESVIVTTDRKVRTITHRNSFGGWLNALERAGINPDDVVADDELRAEILAETAL